MSHTTTLIIGAGPAGLAMSCNLTERAIEHVLLEKTPAWQDLDDERTRPLTARELLDHATYTASLSAPVHDQTNVQRVRRLLGGYAGFEVQTDQGLWCTRAVVIATGSLADRSWLHERAAFDPQGRLAPRERGHHRRARPVRARSGASRPSALELPRRCLRAHRASRRPSRPDPVHRVSDTALRTPIMGSSVWSGRSSNKHRVAVPAVLCLERRRPPGCDTAGRTATSAPDTTRTM